MPHKPTTRLTQTNLVAVRQTGRLPAGIATADAQPALRLPVRSHQEPPDGPLKPVESPTDARPGGTPYTRQAPARGRETTAHTGGIDSPLSEAPGRSTTPPPFITRVIARRVSRKVRLAVVKREPGFVMDYPVVAETVENPPRDGREPVDVDVPVAALLGVPHSDTEPVVGRPTLNPHRTLTSG